jgi:hypothetical protein
MELEDDHKLDFAEKTEIVEVLASLNLTKASICEGMILTMDYA